MKLDDIARHHAEAARRTVEDAEPPDLPTGQKVRRAPSMAPIAAAVAVIALFVVPFALSMGRNTDVTTETTPTTAVDTAQAQEEAEEQAEEIDRAHDSAMCEAAAAQIEAGEEFLGFVEDARLPLQVPAYLADGSRESVTCHRGGYPYVLEVTRTDPSSRTFLAPPDAALPEVAEAVRLDEAVIHEIDDGIYSTMAAPENDPSGTRPLPIGALVAERTVTSGLGIDPEAPEATPLTVPDPDNPAILLINDMGVEVWADWGGEAGDYFETLGPEFTVTEGWGQDYNKDKFGLQVHFGFDESNEVTVYGLAPIDTTAVRMNFPGIPPIYVTRLFERPQVERSVFVGTIPLEWLVEAEPGGLELTAVREGDDFTPEYLTGYGTSSGADADLSNYEQVGDIFRTPLPLVMDRVELASLPEVMACTGGDVPNRSGQSELGHQPTADGALEAFLTDGGELFGGQPEGWIEITTADGDHAYARPFYYTSNEYEPVEEGVVILVTVEENEQGWTATEWESSGC